MDHQPNLIVKSVLKPNQDESSPTKCTPIRLAPATSTSKVLIITPEQIAKLGLTQQINKAVQSQVVPNLPSTSTKSETHEPPRKKNVRISKITIINPNPKPSLEEPEVKKSPLVSNQVANIMKSKLSNLLRSRPPIQIPSTSCNKTIKIEEVKPEGRKRKLDEDEDDDDVILIDNQDDTKVEEVEPPQTVSVIVKNELNDSQPVIRQSRIKPIPNIIRKIVLPTVKIDEVEDLPVKETPPVVEDVKQKIHVLSNEQISLPQTYIASLKSQLSERLAKPASTPFLIYKTSPNLDVKPIIDLVKEEPEEVVTKIELKEEEGGMLRESRHLVTNNQLATVFIVHPTPPVVENDSIVILNDSFNSEVSSEVDNKDSEENPSVIDLTETVEEEQEIQKKVIEKKVKKISKPLQDKKIEFKITEIKKTYSKETNILLEKEQAKQLLIPVPEITKPSPKKRGRKKKSEMIQTEILTPPAPCTPEPEIEVSRRGRKRKVVDYYALSEGHQYDEPELPPKKPKRNTMNHNTDILEIDTTISCNPIDNTINCSYTSQEITPKRKRGRPPKKKVVEEQIEEKTIIENKIIEIDSDDAKETNEVASTSENKTKQINLDDSRETNKVALTSENEMIQINLDDSKETNEVASTSENEAIQINLDDLKKTNEVALTSENKTIQINLDDSRETNEVASVGENETLSDDSKETNEVAPTSENKTIQINMDDPKETNEVASTSENETIEINSDDSKETNELSSPGGNETIQINLDDSQETNEVASIIENETNQLNLDDSQETNEVASTSENETIQLNLDDSQETNEVASTSENKTIQINLDDLKETNEEINTSPSKNVEARSGNAPTNDNKTTNDTNVNKTIEPQQTDDSLIYAKQTNKTISNDTSVNKTIDSAEKTNDSSINEKLTNEMVASETNTNKTTESPGKSNDSTNLKDTIGDNTLEVNETNDDLINAKQTNEDVATETNMNKTNKKARKSNDSLVNKTTNLSNTIGDNAFEVNKTNDDLINAKQTNEDVATETNMNKTNKKARKSNDFLVNKTTNLSNTIGDDAFEVNKTNDDLINAKQTNEAVDTKANMNKTTEDAQKSNDCLVNETTIGDNAVESNKANDLINAKQTNEAIATETNPNKTTSVNKTNIEDHKTTDAIQINEVSSIETIELPTKKPTPKKRRGRSCRDGTSAAAQLVNTMFQQMSPTPTLNIDNNETLTEAAIEDESVTVNKPEVPMIFVKPEFSESNFQEQLKKNTRTKKKRGKQKEPIEETSTASNSLMVTCAVCSKEVSKFVWANHKQRFHNNLAWKIGDPPLDLNDQKFVMRVLSEIYKRRKPLYCEKCGESKKSVIGFLSHKTMCQKSTEEVTAMRIKCEFCDRTMLPVSMSMHLKYCRANGDNSSFDDNHSVSSFLDSPVQGKRRAAQKAHGLIKSLKEDGEIETTASKRHVVRWYVNFDFKPTYFGRRRFRTEIAKNGVAKCSFEGCNFQSSDVEEISSHLYTCDRKPTQGFTCKFCIKTFETHNEVIEHLKEAHASVDKDETSPYEERSEGEDLEEEFIDDNEETDKIIVKPKVAVNSRANLLHGIKFLLKHRYCVPNTQIAYPPALDWMLKFCKQNFSISNLFPNWRTTSENWEKLQPTLMANYLPHLKYSACTSVVESNKFVDPLKLVHEWKRYKLFEATTFINGSTLIFCGGPILAMAWAPTPYVERTCHQILAISTNHHPDKEYTFDIKYTEPGLIQFWNCGPLSNESEQIRIPKLEFCIAHDYGPIWHLEWCPSGCYDLLPDLQVETLQRLGVLAIASGNSNIYVYSICYPGEIRGKILKTKPILKLTLESVIEHTPNDLEGHVTKISWSKASGHQYLVAGYANGMVAAYYIDTTSTLLNLGLDPDGIETIMPYRVFPAHNHAITALSLYHLNDGRRWIMTGSVDRTTKYWDLENPIVPLTNFSKYIVTDGVWLSHWLSSLHSFDDSCAGGLTFTLAHQARNFESESTSVMHSNSRVACITGSEWINGFVQGNVAGELQGFFPHQMFFSMDGDKSFRNKKVMLGYTRLVEKDLSIPDRLAEEKHKLQRIYNKSKQPDGEDSLNRYFSKIEPTTYKEAAQKYGLAFCDMKLKSGKEFNESINSYYASNKLQKFYTTRPNVYPLQSITKVAFNPNQGSYLYLATGYQAGFVKISYMQFFNGKRKC